jgi:hypothetical protein
VEGDLREYLSKTVPADKLDGEISRYANQVLTESRQSLQHAWAIMRLVERFSPKDTGKMEPATRSKWFAMISRHARNFEQENTALRSSLQSVFSPAEAIKSSPETLAIESEADLANATKHLFDLCFSNWTVVRSAFTLSEDRTLAPRIKKPEFWNSIDQAQGYAQKIQEATSVSQK